MTTLSSSRRSGSGRPTMVDVAREASVSLKTVSRVVNGEAGVRADTASRVQAVIGRLGFQRNDGASQLRRGKTASIGLIVEDLANPFYSQLTAAVEREARHERHLLISASAEGSAEREAELVDAFASRRVDGLVAVPAGPSELGTAQHRLWGAPVVYVDRPVEGAAADTVLSDNAGGIRSAVEHLAAHGHRGIAFLADDPAFWTTRQREKAFKETHSALRLPGRARIARGPHTAETLLPRLEAWTRGANPVTAVVTGNNRVTIAALHAMRELTVPLSIVGYDDFELADLVQPAVTVVHQDPAAMGQRAAQQLFARLRGDDAPPRTLTMPTRLIVRASGERAAGGR